jgi:hypothetical protein
VRRLFLRGPDDRADRMNRLRRYLAARRLQRMVDEQRNSYETRRYRERRAAALKGRRKVVAQ